MPYTLTSEDIKASGADLRNVDYGYSYPKGLDLKPGSELHQKIISEVGKRVRDGQDAMKGRYDSWREIDRVLTAFVPPKKKREAKEAGDKTYPIVVPTSYATLETLLTYMTAVFLQMPYFKYSGVGSEDTVGAMLLEQIISFQTIRASMGLNLHTLWRDSFSYGFGALTPHWGEKRGWRRTKSNIVIPNWTGLFGKKTSKRRRESVVLYQGNYLRNIDPYLYLPDPTVAIQDVQDGEFVGWIDMTNRIKILEQERDRDSFFFNAEYLQHISGRSSAVLTVGKKAGTPRTGRHNVFVHMDSTKPVDVTYMYINLVPKDWKMGKSKYPEKWLFAVAGDAVVLAAQPLGLDHDMFPVVIAAPDYDGYSVNPISRLEMGYGLQDTIDWLLHSHIANVRKAINDMLIVDPFLVNMNDLSNPEPGKLIRTRRAHWGKGVEHLVEQLQVRDFTANHMKDIQLLTDTHNKSVGTPENVQGIMRGGGERRSATEARDTKQSALSKLEKVARILDIQYRQPLSMMLASHTQQFQTQERYVEISGSREQELVKEYGLDIDGEGRVSANPLDMLINFDILPGDGTIPGREPADLWIQLFQIIATQPILAQQFDMVRIFQHAARQLGARNVNDFVKKGGNVQAEIMPTDQVQQQVQAGNLLGMQ